ncbi:hypothetical protein SAMN02745157_2527 [Kaistia soli DSM 19436]|uniref:Uncharacterized protein n=1 Tax=Kaistia soli DSM 19436 TaxID=1122133 RepID=A0A1M5D0X9_9HYPH|nr:hypothetical protein [Kaistia soli]SHF60666.1 hypothetical protein SAMN02745157_2527 [Kaistia soli DSM 19436]
MERRAKFSRDGQLIEDDDDILRDGQTLRIPVMLRDGSPAPAGTPAADTLPPNVTVLADGSARHTFDDGSAVLMMGDGSRRYLDAAGNPAKSLTLVQQAHAEGAAGRAGLIDRHAHVDAAHRAYEANLNTAWRNGA